MSRFYNDTLAHTDQKKKHKYVAKIKKGLKWRYFYTKAEYDTYLKNKNQVGSNKEKTSLLDKIETAIGSSLQEAKKKVNDILDKIGDKDPSDIGEKEPSKKSKTADYDDGKGEPKDHKYIAKIKMKNGKFRYFYSQKELASYYATHPDEVPDNAKGLPLLKKAETPEEAMKHINNHYDPGDWDSGYDNNCYSCTLAYDMRRRGYDVDSIYDENGDTLDNIEACYKDAHFEQTRSKGSKLQKELSKKYPEGAHGQICVAWKGGGGHSMVWEIHNGKAIIRDCQSGTIYTNFDKVVSNKNVAGKVNILRTDDKQISDVMATRVTTDQRQNFFDEYADAGYADYIDQLHEKIDPLLDQLEDYNHERKKNGIEVVASKRRRQKK